jgi:hypothetical protein
MHWEAHQWTLNGIVKGEMIEEKKWIKRIGTAGRDRSQQSHSRSFDDQIWLNNIRYCT